MRRSVKSMVMAPLFAAALSVGVGLTLLGQPAQAQDSLRAAAVVNDDVISILDVVMRIRLAIIGAGVPDTPEARDKIGPNVLQKLIDEKLQLQEAERLDISVPDDDVRDAVAGLAQQNKMRPGAFLEILTKNRVAPEILFNQIRAELAWRQVVRVRLLPSINITEDDVDAVINRILNDDKGLQYRVAEIFLAVPDASSEARVRQNIDRMLEEVKGGANFSGLARQFSQAPSAQLGGDLGWVDAGNLTDERAGAIKQLEPGQIAGPIRTLDGYSLLHLRDKRTRSENEIDREQVRSRLQEERAGQLAQRSLQELRRSANIDIRI